MTLPFLPADKILFIGDSVTDSERARPVGEGLFGATGKGWVSLVDAALTVHHPELRLRVVNMGVSGNQVRHLADRWATDVLAQKPDWVSVMIGINDVWRQFDLPRQVEQHVGLKEYERTLSALIRKTQPKVRGMILATPFFIEPLKSDAMRSMMDQYGAVVARLAQSTGCRFVDTQAAFDRLCTHMHSSAIAWDRIHPNHIGHMALADAWLEAVA